MYISNCKYLYIIYQIENLFVDLLLLDDVAGEAILSCFWTTLFSGFLSIRVNSAFGSSSNPSWYPLLTEKHSVTLGN